MMGGPVLTTVVSAESSPSPTDRARGQDNAALFPRRVGSFDKRAFRREKTAADLYRKVSAAACLVCCESFEEEAT